MSGCVGVFTVWEKEQRYAVYTDPVTFQDGYNKNMNTSNLISHLKSR